MNATLGRLLGREHERHEDYVYCAVDGFWFRPAYTDGKCPLCGEPGPMPPAGRLDRSLYGIAALTLESLVMLTLVLVMYFR